MVEKTRIISYNKTILSLKTSLITHKKLMNFKNIFLIISLFLGITLSIASCVYFYNWYNTPKFATQLIVTIIDDYEPSSEHNHIDKNNNLTLILGPCTKTLLAALLQEECIIIVNSSVMHYLMHYLNTFNCHDNPFNLYPAKKIEPSHWIKKKIDDYLYVFIPKNYAENRYNYKQLKKLSFAHIYDLQELTLGIKIHASQTLSDNAFMQAETYMLKDQYKTAANAENISWISEHCSEQLDKIFIKKSEYENLIDYAPRSIIIAEGHGTRAYPPRFSGILAGFNTKDFGTFVTFLENNLSIKLLLLNSCYGSPAIIDETLQSAQQQPSFPIISAALCNAQSCGGIETYETWKRTRKNISQISLAKPVFKDFFNVLYPHENPSNKVFLQAIDHIYGRSQKNDTNYNNIPSIKQPGQPWKLFEKTYILTLDETFLGTHNEKTFLDVSLLLKNNREYDSHNVRDTYPYIILLDAPEIPHELILSGQNPIDMPAFIPLRAGESIYHFTKIDAHTFCLSSCFEAFFKIPDLYENKTCIIDELLAINNCAHMPHDGECITIKNVIITNATGRYHEKPKKSVTFEYDGIKWAADIDKDIPTYKAVHDTTT